MPRSTHRYCAFVVLVVGLVIACGLARAEPAGLEPKLAAPEGSYLLAFSDNATASMVGSIRKGSEACERLPWAYRYDCLAETFRKASRANRDRPDYRDARTILSDAGKKLDALVDQNLDSTKPKAKVGRKAYRPVRDVNRTAVSKTGRAIVQETEIRLLRSGGSQKRQEHFQRVAAAVEATELLLRAGLLSPLPRLAVAAALLSVPCADA